MASYRAQYIVKPGRRVRLKHIDPGYHGKHASHEDAISELQSAVEEIDRLQAIMYAEKKHSLLIVLQGLDAGGKDSVIRHVLTGMNPQGCKVASFKEPTPAERDHDFLWRVHPHAPARGDAAIFNRSHYECVLIERVHGLAPKDVWKKRYELINDFERLLSIDNGTTILKFFLHISKDEQLARFAQRLEDPARNWKISESDYKEREFWDAYAEAFEDMFSKTSTDYAPWYIIPANHKWFCHLAISRIIVETMEEMKIKTPKPRADLKEIRREYHSAVKEERAGRT